MAAPTHSASAVSFSGLYTITFCGMAAKMHKKRKDGRQQRNSCAFCGSLRQMLNLCKMRHLAVDFRDITLVLPPLPASFRPAGGGEVGRSGW